MRFHARESMSGAATATIDNTERPAGVLCCVSREFDRLDLCVRVVVSQTELPNYGNVQLPSGTDRAAFQLSHKRHCEKRETSHTSKLLRRRSHDVYARLFSYRRRRDERNKRRLARLHNKVNTLVVVHAVCNASVMSASDEAPKSGGSHFRIGKWFEEDERSNNKKNDRTRENATRRDISVNQSQLQMNVTPSNLAFSK